MKGEQIYTCYGRRTNKFLLLWYGFTFEKNQYDSFNFRLWMNMKPMPFTDEIFNTIVI